MVTWEKPDVALGIKLVLQGIRRISLFHQWENLQLVRKIPFLSNLDSRVHPLKLGGLIEETKENGNFADLGLAFAISELYSTSLASEEILKR